MSRASETIAHVLLEGKNLPVIERSSDIDTEVQGMASVSNPDRREFLKKSGAVTAAVLAGSALPAGAAAKTLPALPSNPHTQTTMPTRNLGKTGYKVGVFSLGGQAALEKPNNEAIAVPIVEKALDLGVNY